MNDSNSPKPVSAAFLEIPRIIKRDDTPSHPPFNTEIETGSTCTNTSCLGKVVAYHTQVHRPRTGLEPIGPGCAPGSIPHIEYSTKYYCDECQVLYNKPPTILQKKIRVIPEKEVEHQQA